jgi:O-antigen ligase
MARSRAGLGLTIVALFGAFALSPWDRRSASGITTAKLLVGAIALAAMLTTQFVLYRIMERFASDPLADSRIGFARNTMEAANAYMPLGSGMGTFVPVYGLFEKPADAIVDAYVNHAHNDVIELWLESGVAGLVLMGLFAIWLALRSVEVWRRAVSHGREIDRSLARAATVVIALLIAHSFVDYPLRTGALMAILAFACALLLDPPIDAEKRDVVEAQGVVQTTRNFPRAVATSSAAHSTTKRTARSSIKPSEIPSPRSSEWRSANIEWPEEWRKSIKDRPLDSNNNPATSRKTSSD